MKLESSDILPKIDNTVVAIVTIVVLPRLTDPLILNFEIKKKKTKIETLVALKRNCLVWLFLNNIFFHFLKHLFLLSQRACRKSPL